LATRPAICVLSVGQEGIQLALGGIAVADQGLDVGIGIAQLSGERRQARREGGEIAVGRLQGLEILLPVDHQVDRLGLGLDQCIEEFLPGSR
jgi:hypothetical protein